MLIAFIIIVGIIVAAIIWGISVASDNKNKEIADNFFSSEEVSKIIDSAAEIINKYYKSRADFYNDGRASHSENRYITERILVSLSEYYLTITYLSWGDGDESTSINFYKLYQLKVTKETELIVRDALTQKIAAKLNCPARLENGIIYLSFNNPNYISSSQIKTF